MEIVLCILMLFIVLNTLFRLSFHPLAGRIAFAVAAAGFVLWNTRYAVLQSKTQIADYLQDKQMLQNMAILVTLESAVCFAHCITRLNRSAERKAPVGARLLAAYPSLLLFPVLFFALTESIFALTGTDFMHTAAGLAAACLVVLPLAPAGIRMLFPAEEERLEIHFLLNLSVCAIGLITTVNGETVYAAAQADADWSDMARAAAGFLFIAVAGYAAARLRWRFKKQHHS
ncbi:MAG: hypothetical protein J6B92_09985 [Paraprevotella sp.]|nr:hypothetical protein [Paraprevotella sp.]